MPTTIELAKIALGANRDTVAVAFSDISDEVRTAINDVVEPYRYSNTVLGKFFASAVLQIQAMRPDVVNKVSGGFGSVGTSYAPAIAQYVIGAVLRMDNDTSTGQASAGVGSSYINTFFEMAKAVSVSYNDDLLESYRKSAVAKLRSLRPDVQEVSIETGKYAESIVNYVVGSALNSVGKDGKLMLALSDQIMKGW